MNEDLMQQTVVKKYPRYRGLSTILIVQKTTQYLSKCSPSPSFSYTYLALMLQNL